MQINPDQPLVVQIYREPFDIFYTLVLPDGSTEELDREETSEWFRQRGANMENAEKAIDYAWNFCTGPSSTYTVAVKIHKPKAPVLPGGSLAPDL